MIASLDARTPSNDISLMDWVNLRNRQAALCSPVIFGQEAEEEKATLIEAMKMSRVEATGTGDHQTNHSDSEIVIQCALIILDTEKGDGDLGHASGLPAYKMMRLNPHSMESTTVHRV